MGKQAKSTEIFEYKVPIIRWTSLKSNGFSNTMQRFSSPWSEHFNSIVSMYLDSMIIHLGDEINII